MQANLQLQSFFEHLSSWEICALALDYDGTLAPFHIDRHAATPYPGVSPLIRAIQATGRTRVVLISGRPAEEVRNLVGLDPAPEIWGSHGRQRMWPDGRVELVEISDEERETLAEVDLWLRHHRLEHLAECKPGSIAIHWRGLPAEEVLSISRAARTALEPLATRARMSLLDFDGGIELRPLQPNKGSAVLTLLRELPPKAPLAYLGDDTTDEDAFLALRGTGALTVLVRPERRETNAEIWIQPPDDLLDFLRRWLATTGGER